MNKVCLTGYYGMLNYGDDLFAVATSKAVQAHWQSSTPVVAGPRSIGVDVRYGALSFLPGSLYSRMDYAGKLARAATLFSNTLRAQRLVFAGGSVFHGESSRVSELAARAAKSLRTEVAALGVSIGPFPRVEDERKTGELLKRFSYISTRDSGSYAAAMSLGLDVPINLGADLAACYDKAAGNPHRHVAAEPSRVGFSPCFLPAARDAGRAHCDEFVRYMVQRHREMGQAACVIELNHHPSLGDRELCAYTTRRLSDEGVPSTLCTYQELGIDGIWALVSSLDHYLSVRLHGAVTAYLCGTPFYLWQYHEKCTDFLREIGCREPEMWRSLEACAASRGTAVLSTSELIPSAEYRARALTNLTSAPWNA